MCASLSTYITYLNMMQCWALIIKWAVMRFVICNRVLPSVELVVIGCAGLVMPWPDSPSRCSRGTTNNVTPTTTCIVRQGLES